MRILWSSLTRNKKGFVGFVIVLFFVSIALLAPYISPFNPNDMVDVPMQSPSFSHWLGTNHLGQDILSRVIWGTRNSLMVGILTGTLSVFISLVIGLSAGYFGGIVDELLTTLINIFLIIPGLPLMIVIAAYLHFKGLTPIILVIAITGWPSGARILRSQMLSLKNREFVVAARILGENPIRIIFSEIFPLMFSLVVANFFSATLYAILGEASLEFLGLGNVNLVTWGTILYWAQNNQALLNGAWWWILAPGLCISLLGAGFALLNFSMDEISNPKLRGGE